MAEQSELNPRQTEPDSSTEHPLPRGVQLGLVAVIVLAFLGFFVGIQQEAWLADRLPPTALVPSDPADDLARRLDRDVIPALSYAELDRRQFGPNRDWHSRLDTKPTLTALLEVGSTDIHAETDAETDTEHNTEHNTDEITGQDNGFAPASRVFADSAVGSPASARQLAEALTKRSRRRAFEGAPPVVPHPVDSQGTSSCLACHAEGRLLGRGIVAPAMSHALLANCTQCHVEDESFAWRSRWMNDDVEVPENTFSGYQSRGSGTRAWPGAPPTVPHPIAMRETCLSCHGPHGTEPLRTSHPFRANCLQCHAPQSEWDPLFRQPARDQTSSSYSGSR